jgi:hypothetical protein
MLKKSVTLSLDEALVEIDGALAEVEKEVVIEEEEKVTLLRDVKPQVKMTVVADENLIEELEVIGKKYEGGIVEDT